MADWSAANLQFVWFVADTSNVDVEAIFKALLDADPETVQRSKAPRPNNPFLGLAEGELEGLSHRVTIQPGRVDYIAQSSAPSDFGPSLIEHPGSLLQQLVTQVAKLEITAVRLALVVNLMKIETSQAAANSIINEMIGKPFPFDDASDLSFQVNRRKSLALNVEINRLLRYNVGAFQFLQISVQPGLVQSAPPMSETFAANVIVDVNSVPSDAVFAPAQVKSIWHSLADESARIIKDPSVRVLA